MAKSKIIAQVTSADVDSLYDLSDLELIRDHPHVLGHLVGYDKLKPIHGEWIHKLFTKRGIKVESMQAHRGSYKSTVVTVGIVWRMLFFPEDTICVVRKAATEAFNVVGDVAKIMKMAEVKELFKFAHGEYPAITREKVGEGLLDFSFRKKPNTSPSVTGLGRDSQLTGKHYSTIVIDDLSVLASRVSKAERTKDQAAYREIVTNLQNRGDHDTGFTRIVGTPWCVPGSGGIEDLMPEPSKYYMEDTQLISPEQLAEIKRSTTYQLFVLNYELSYISSDTSVFSNPTWGEWDYINSESPRACIDFAYSKEGDNTALCIGSRKRDGNIQMVGFLFKGNGFDWIDRICEILKLYKCRWVAVETNRDAGWGQVKLKEKGLSVHAYNEGMKKNVKIATYGLEVWSRVIWAKETDAEFMNQVLDWQDLTSSQCDDGPDAYASLVRGAFSKRTANNARWMW